MRTRRKCIRLGRGSTVSFIPGRGGGDGRNNGILSALVAGLMQGEEIVDVKVEYPDSFVMQMLEYGERYSRLPVVN